MELEKEIYKALLGEKKAEIINLLCELSDENGFIVLKISDICEKLNVSKPTVISTFKLLEERKIFERVKNGVYRFKNL
ncbi:replication/maintenance protein RepL [Campylobacter concisus]|uniref:replication/maintenance protein RepL n=1 Tax=Campylobacter concisus TaxID=199 RepID=UPI000CD8E351|nr:replication/maintenance protein RepL [Campylobacter concisus]